MPMWVSMSVTIYGVYVSVSIDVPIPVNVHVHVHVRVHVSNTSNPRSHPDPRPCPCLRRFRSSWSCACACTLHIFTVMFMLMLKAIFKAMFRYVHIAWTWKWTWTPKRTRKYLICYPPSVYLCSHQSNIKISPISLITLIELSVTVAAEFQLGIVTLTDNMSFQLFFSSLLPLSQRTSESKMPTAKLKTGIFKNFKSFESAP